MTTTIAIAEHRFRRRLLLIGGAAIVLRVAMGALHNVEHGKLRGYQFYLEMAENLLAGDGYHWRFYLGMGEKWANRPPGYPLLLLAAIKIGFWPWSAVLLQSFVGGLTVVVAGWLGRRLATPGAGLLAAALVAVYPYFVVLDTAMLEHGLLTLAVALVALAFLETVRRGGVAVAALLGAALAFGVMARVSFAPAVPLVLLALLPGLGMRRGIGLAVVAGLVAAVGVVPWVARNAAAVGSPVLSSDMGRALWVGNNEWTYRIYPEESIDQAENRAYRELPEEVRRQVRETKEDELGQSAVFRRVALDRIRAHPGEFARGMLVKLGAFFSPILNPPTEPPEWKNVVYTGTYLPALGLGIFGFWLLRRRWRLWLAGPAMLVALAVTAAVFWGESRHRAPLDVLLLVAAAAILPWLKGELPTAPEASPKSLDRSGSPR